MATDLERLVVQLSADVRSYQNQLVRASGFTVRQFRNIEQRGQQFQRRLSDIGRNAGLGFARGLAGPLLGAASVQGATALIDQAQRIENQLRITGLEGAELEKVYDSLYKSALRNAAPFQDLVTVYSRAAIASKELGITTEETTRFVDTIAVALRVNGRSAAETQGALLQLSQALGGTIVRAEEFNSLLEGALPILQASANGLEEAGGSVAKLRQIMLDGRLSSQAFFRSIEAGTPYLQDLADNATLTITQRLENLRTGLIDAAKEFNESTKAGASFGAEIDRISAFINGLDFDHIIGEIQKVTGALSNGIEAAQGFARTLGELSGLDAVGEYLTGGSGYREFLGGAISITSSRGIESRINDAFAEQIESVGALTEQAIRDSVLGEGANPNLPQSGPIPAQRNAGQIQTVSLRDFATPPGAKGAGSGGRGSQRISDAERERQQIENVIETLRFEQEQLGRTAVQQEIYNQLKRAGVDLTSEAGQQISNLVIQTAELADAQKLANEQQEAFNDGLEQISADAIDAFGNVIAGTEDAADAFKKLAIEIVKSAITGKGAYSDFFQSISGGSNGGILGFLGGLFGRGGLSSGALSAVRGGSGGLYADGGYTGPGGVNQPAGVVHAGEVVWSQADIRRAGGVSVVEGMRRGLSGYNNGGVVSALRAPSMPNLRGMNSGGGGGRLNVDVGVTVDDDGALQGYVRSVSEDAAASGIARWSGSQDFRLRTGNIADQRIKNPRGGIR